MKTEPKYPEGEMMIADPENTGHYIRRPEADQQAQQYDEWVWNDKAKNELDVLNDRIQAFLAKLENS